MGRQNTEWLLFGCSIELNMDLPQAQSTAIASAGQASQQQVSYHCKTSNALTHHQVADLLLL